jgi:L-ascorbate metabolism protein UlaG (beta-lactamase superfamily)
MHIRYVGHSCFIIEGSKTLLFDPMPLDDPASAGADLTLISHAHADHIGDSPERFSLTAAVHELSGYLKSLGVPTIGMNIGGSVEYEGVTVRMVQATHSSSIRQKDGTSFYMGQACGFIVEMDGHVIYYAGDTGLFSDMKLLRELYHPDIAILPVGGRYTMGPEECMMAAAWVGAKTVIPMHVNTYPEIEQDMPAFKRAIELTTVMHVEIMQPGESLELP